ncbi:putative non-LTR retroelement reverse transcriptase, partial [Trifolium medium]|nr:putative non-LTR retroelement reverse transcriptase [Trifolium medium]
KLGGLGVRDIRAVNISLLAKWRWRLLEDDNAMWKEGVIKRIGCGDQTKFWRDIWVGTVPLQDKFPRLFSVSTQKDCNVVDLREMVEGVVNWRFVWRRRLFVWEENLVMELLEIINQVVLSEECDK